MDAFTSRCLGFDFSHECLLLGTFRTSGWGKQCLPSRVKQTSQLDLLKSASDRQHQTVMRKSNCDIRYRVGLICAMRRTAGSPCSVFSLCLPGESTLRGKAPHRILDRGPISNPTLAPLLSQKCGRFYGSKRRSAQLNWRCVRSWETGTRHWEGFCRPIAAHGFYKGMLR